MAAAGPGAPRPGGSDDQPPSGGPGSSASPPFSYDDIVGTTITSLQIAGPLTFSQLLRTVGCDEQQLYAVVDILVACSLVSEQEVVRDDGVRYTAFVYREGAVVPEGVDIAGVRQEILDLQREVAVAAGRISALDSIKPSARKSKDGLREQVERFCTDGSGGQEDPLYAFLLPELRAKAAQATSGRRGRTKTKRASASGAEPQQ